jgi:hypothetical protein
MKTQKMGRNPFQPVAPRKAEAAVTDSAEAPKDDSTLPRPSLLIKNLLVYLMAESTLQALKALEVAAELLSSRKSTTA